MARKATCEGITVDICILMESSAHGEIGWISNEDSGVTLNKL
jgi:hypothetical protein